MLRDPCEDIWPLLSQMQDGELLVAERATVGQHLEGCAACRRRLAEYEEIGRLVALPAPDPAESLLGSFRLRLATERSRSADENWPTLAETQEQPFDGPR